MSSKMRVKSDLKRILNERDMSIRKLEKDTGIAFETLRRLHNDTTKQYNRDTIGQVCQVLGVEVGELLTLVPANDDD